MVENSFLHAYRSEYPKETENLKANKTIPHHILSCTMKHRIYTAAHGERGSDLLTLRNPMTLVDDLSSESSSTSILSSTIFYQRKRLMCAPEMAEYHVLDH
jgi:hypothetical protein